MKKEPAGAAEAKKEEGGVPFKEKDQEIVKVIRKHYLRNSFFFFVGVFCAILGASKSHCIIISYLVLAEKVAEIVGLFFRKLLITYIAHALMVIVNYVNIITAIVWVSKDEIYV